MEGRYIVAKRRSEQGKLIRRLYKNDIGVPYQLCKGYSLMLDGYSNTITTFTTEIGFWNFKTTTIWKT